jgi:methanethiol S-methyltransferase
MNTQTLDKEATRTVTEKMLFARGFALIYAFFAYAVGAGALFWFFFAAIGMAPYSLSVIEASNLLSALAINALLVLVFGAQHTIMARKSFKEKWT